MKYIYLLIISFNVIATDLVGIETALKNGDTKLATKLIVNINKDSLDYSKIDYLNARVAFRDGDLDLAEDYIEKAVKSYPHANVYNLAGGIYGSQAGAASIFSKLGYAKKSKKYLKMAYDAEPTNKEYIQGLISFNIQAPSLAGGDMDAVEPLLKQLEKIDKISAVQMRTQYIIEEDDEEVALKYLSKVINENPDVLEYKFYRGTIYSSMQQYNKAQNDFQSVINYQGDGWKTNSSRINSLYQFGRLASMQNKWLEKGKTYFLEFLSLEDIKDAPPKSWATYRLGLIYQHLNKETLAIQSFAKANNMNPPDNLKKRLAKVL